MSTVEFLRATLENAVPYLESRVEDMAENAAEMLGRCNTHKCACLVRAARVLAETFEALDWDNRSMAEHKAVRRMEGMRRVDGLLPTDHPDCPDCDCLEEPKDGSDHHAIPRTPAAG